MRAERAWLLLGLAFGCNGGRDKDLDDTSSHDSSTSIDSDEGAPDSGETAETGDSGDSAAPVGCEQTLVTFEGDDGVSVDLTEPLLAGTYTTLDAPGRLLVCPGTWFARLLIRANVEVVGLGAGPEDTVLSGGESGTILDVAGPDVTLTVHNLTLDRGAGLDEAHNSGGGGIYCEAFGAVSATDVVFSHNFANDGPGLYAEDCVISLSETQFIDNLAEDDGGALTLWFSTLTMDQGELRDNVGLDGGAIAMFYSAATLSDVLFQDNTSGMYAGGLWLYNGTLSLTDTTFTGNVNTGMNGGGLLAYGEATLTRVSFDGNSATHGGGLFVYYESVVSGTDCDFGENSPEDLYAADYTEAGGVSYSAGAGYSFACAENVCAEE